MRRALSLLLALTACAAEVPLLPDAGACGGACGAGTECVGGRCVAVDGGELVNDAATDAPPATTDACLRPVWQDLDGDGYGAGAPRMATCTILPAGFSMVNGDCDDANPAAHPTATETCNGVDEDCDGHADDDPTQVLGPGGTVPRHSLNDWCEAQLARHPDLAARVRAFGGLRRCLSSQLVPSTSPYLSREARCFAGDGNGTGPEHQACWRAAGEIPCR